jgi:hypothetical protein
MQIKPHSTENEYIRAGGLWVRNFTKKVVPLSINHMFHKDDYQEVFLNVSKNSRMASISDETIVFEKIVIVSDGFNFSKTHYAIQDFPKDVSVLAVNGALRQWELMSPPIDPPDRRSVNGYIVNNPYKECLKYLPKSDTNYYPTCLASSKTSHKFVQGYKGDVYFYEPTPENYFGASKRKSAYYIDDYRNPICAAIGLAYQFGVKKLMLMCCDDSFERERDYAVQLENGLWAYPQQLRSHEIIDANLYWLTHQPETDVEVADLSNGPKYVNATYISCSEEARRFFEDDSQEEEGAQNDK